MKTLTYDLCIHNAHRVVCDPGWHWESLNNRWQGLHLWAIEDGRGELEAPGRTYPLSRGDCFVLRMEEPHVGRHDPDHPLIVSAVHFDLLTSQGDRFIPSLEEMPRHRRLTNPELFFEVISRCLAALQDQGGEGRGGTGLALHWLRSCLLLFGEGQEGVDGWVEDPRMLRLDQVVREVREHPERPWSVTTMADDFYLSEDHFIRLFRARFGRTPGDLLIQSRIEKAESLLRFSSHSIKEVAALLGYREPYFFSRQFRQRTGLTPSDYRRCGQAGESSFQLPVVSAAVTERS